MGEGRPLTPRQEEALIAALGHPAHAVPALHSRVHQTLVDSGLIAWSADQRFVLTDHGQERAQALAEAARALPSPPTVDLPAAELWMRYVAQQDPPSDTSEAHRLVISALDDARAEVKRVRRDVAAIAEEMEGEAARCERAVDVWFPHAIWHRAARLRGIYREPSCCDLHGRTCEPPSELCCSACTESAHPQHADGSACSNPDLSPAP